jgi:hypothetical protein
VRADDGRAEELALRIGDELGKARGGAVGARAIDLVEREPVDAVRDARSPGLGFRQADACQFGVGVRAPRNDRRGLRPLHPEDRVPQDDAGVVLGQVRELVAAGDIADRIDVSVGRAQPVVEHEASALDAHVGRVETEALDVRGAARGQQQVRSGEHAHGLVRRAHGDTNIVLATSKANDRRAQMIAHALGAQLLHYDGGRVRILARQNLGCDVDHTHLAAQAPECLRQFAADRSRAHHDQ